MASNGPAPTPHGGPAVWRRRAAELTRQPVSARAAVVAAVALAAATSFTALGYQPLSWDEAVSANAAHRSLPDLWHLLEHTDAPLGAYYLTLHVWVRILDAAGIAPTAVWLRLPSALAGIAAVALTVRLGVRLRSPVVGLIAGVVLAVHPLFVFYTHDTRPYAIAVMLAAAATLALLDTLEQPTGRTLATYALLAVALVYAELFAVFVIAAHVLVIWRAGGRHRKFIPVAAVVAAAMVPLVLLSRHQTGEIAWIPAPTWGLVASFLLRIGGGGVMAPLLVVGVILAIPSIRRRRSGRLGTRPLLVSAWALIPPAALITVSSWQPVLIPRYALVCLPALALAFAWILTAVPQRYRVAAVACLVVAGLGSTAIQQAQPYKYENLRSAADAVLDTSRPGDGMLFAPESVRVGIYPYLGPDTHDRAAVVVPTDVALIHRASLYTGPIIGGTEIADTRIPNILRTHRRIYLIGSDLPSAGRNRPGSANELKAAALENLYSVTWHRQFGGVTVTLMTRLSAPGSVHPSR